MTTYSKPQIPTSPQNCPKYIPGFGAGAGVCRRCKYPATAHGQLGLSSSLTFNSSGSDGVGNAVSFPLGSTPPDVTPDLKPDASPSKLEPRSAKGRYPLEFHPKRQSCIRIDKGSRLAVTSLLSFVSHTFLVSDYAFRVVGSNTLSSQESPFPLPTTPSRDAEAKAPPGDDNTLDPIDLRFSPLFLSALLSSVRTKSDVLRDGKEISFDFLNFTSPKVSILFLHSVSLFLFLSLSFFLSLLFSLAFSLSPSPLPPPLSLSPLPPFYCWSPSPHSPSVGSSLFPSSIYSSSKLISVCWIVPFVVVCTQRVSLFRWFTLSSLTWLSVIRVGISECCMYDRNDRDCWQYDLSLQWRHHWGSVCVWMCNPRLCVCVSHIFSLIEFVIRYTSTRARLEQISQFTMPDYDLICGGISFSLWIHFKSLSVADCQPCDRWTASNADGRRECGTDERWRIGWKVRQWKLFAFYCLIIFFRHLLMFTDILLILRMNPLDGKVCRFFGNRKLIWSQNCTLFSGKSIKILVG